MIYIIRMHKLKYSEEKEERKIINNIIDTNEEWSEKGTINCLTMVMKTTNVPLDYETYT